MKKKLCSSSSNAVLKVRFPFFILSILCSSIFAMLKFIPFAAELAGNSDWNQSEFVSICLQANANTKFNWANQGETHNAVCNALAWLKYSSWIIKCVAYCVE